MATSGNDGASSSNLLEKLHSEFLRGKSSTVDASKSKDCSKSPYTLPTDETDCEEIETRPSPARDSHIVHNPRDRGASSTASTSKDDTESASSDEHMNLLKSMQATLSAVVSKVDFMQNQWFEEGDDGMDTETGDNLAINRSPRDQVPYLQTPSAASGGQSCHVTLADAEHGRGVTSPGAVMAAPMPSTSESVETPSAIRNLAEKFRPTEKVSPPVDKGVAELIDGLMTTRLEEKQRQDLGEKYNPPSNMTKLQPPRVNPGIWQIMDTDSKSRDVKSQKIQESLCRGLVPITLAINSLNALSCESEQITQILSQVVDGVALIASASYELSIRRRDLIRQDITPEFKSLCAHGMPVSDFLFGDNLNEKIKELSETNKLMLRVGQRSFAPRGRGAGRGGFRFRGRGGRFLDQRSFRQSYPKHPPH
ncbi:uncharacterized protein LOC124277880 isoform X3 [Haliotis rubra]|nr:uncharacterized protein LOC124277880 isoform X2 [Haliotis rubra]XP_046569564.1 uncharacterized protein LOC124277880 isoform X3 [Haliotis rubra]